VRLSNDGHTPGSRQAFAGACLLTAALLLPHAPIRPLLAGMGLAGLIRWTLNH